MAPCGTCHLRALPQSRDVSNAMSASVMAPPAVQPDNPKKRSTQLRNAVSGMSTASPGAASTGPDASNATTAHSLIGALSRVRTAINMVRSAFRGMRFHLLVCRAGRMGQS